MRARRPEPPSRQPSTQHARRSCSACPPSRLGRIERFNLLQEVDAGREYVPVHQVVVHLRVVEMIAWRRATVGSSEHWSEGDTISAISFTPPRQLDIY